MRSPIVEIELKNFGGDKPQRVGPNTVIEITTMQFPTANTDSNDDPMAPLLVRDVEVLDVPPQGGGGPVNNQWSCCKKIEVGMSVIGGCAIVSFLIYFIVLEIINPQAAQDGDFFSVDDF